MQVVHAESPPIASRAVARLRAASGRGKVQPSVERMLDMERIQGIGQFKTYGAVCPQNAADQAGLAQNHRTLREQVSAWWAWGSCEG